MYDLARSDDEADSFVPLGAEALDLAWRDAGQSLVAVTRNSLVEVRGSVRGQVVQLAEPATAACAGAELVAILGQARLSFYDTNTFALLAVVDRASLPDAFAATLSRMVGRRSDNGSAKSHSSWRKATTDELFTTVNVNGILKTWQVKQDETGRFGVSELPVIPLDTKREWHSVRRTSDGRYLLILSGDNAPDKQPEFRCVNLRSAKPALGLAPRGKDGRSS